jgi:hypothetical protein
MQVYKLARGPTSARHSKPAAIMRHGPSSQITRSVMQNRSPATATPLSRQQRRAAERQAEKAGLRKQAETRQAERIVVRGSGTSSPAGSFGK